MNILRGKKENTARSESPFSQNSADKANSGTSELCRARNYLWHVGKPLQDGVDSFKVITDSAVCHPVVVHDLDPSQLVVGGVNFPPKHLGKEKRGNPSGLGCDQEVLAKEPHTNPLLQVLSITWR